MEDTADLVTLERRLSTNIIRPPYSALNTTLPLRRAEHFNFTANTTIQSYIKLHKCIYQKGLEIRPTVHPFLTGGNSPPEVEDRIMSLYKMKNDSNIISHNSSPCATGTGRDIIRGSSITLVKKALWQYLLAAAPGYCYVLLDCICQEPTICAHLANDTELQNTCQRGDLYLQIGKHPTLTGLGRKALKSLVNPYLYGQQPQAYSKAHGIPLPEAQRYWVTLREIFQPIDDELNRRSQRAFRDGFVRSLDWAARVSPLSNPLAVRNFPVQSAGSDILRRAVIGLYKAGLDLRLTVHDSFLIRVPIAEQGQQVDKAISVIKQASALVLGGFELGVKIDGVFNGQVSGEMM